MISSSASIPLRLVAILLGAFLICAANVKPEPRRLSVLIVDGINNHDWETGTRAAKAILAATRRFNVEVSTTPPREAAQAAWNNWRPQFSKYDAVLVNFNGGHKDDGIRWPTEVEQALEQYVRMGGGLVVLHAANNAFLHWTAWNEMIGLGWRDKSFGPGLTIVNGKVVTIPQGSGMNPGHGPRHDFQMCVLKRDHPITRGLPQCWLHPSEQLTHGQHGPAVGLTVLTYAYSKDSKQNEPLDWVRNYGKGRIYTTMLGHTWKGEANPNLESAGFQNLLARGVEWAASGRVTLPTLTAQSSKFDVAAFDRARVLKAANQYLSEAPITITASSSPRSAGGVHDFFSEGDYWWPDPQNPDGPYIQRDGMTNPDNFVDHRRYLMRLSVQVPALTAAWKLTKDQRYATHAAKHLRAWFIDEQTRMNPNLQYAQAIKGRFTGRGIGIIDTIHLVEVTRAIELLEGSTALSKAELNGVKQWFADYLKWMTTHQYGIDEREAKNNHGTCWVMQVAAFAKLTGNQEFMNYCRERFKTVLVPNQVADDGSFPQELRRTKPYGYSLFNLDAMATICQLLSTPQDNLWVFELSDGRGMRKVMAYMTPYIRDKKSWPLKPDVMYDQEWPMRHANLLFAGQALGNRESIELWKTLKADSIVEEVIRNFFIRQPILWVR